MTVGTPLLQDVRHFRGATGFIPIASERLSVERDGTAAHHKVISPFVWREGQAFQAIFRVVPRSQAKDTNSQLVCAEGDGLYFRLARDPILAPGPDDADGCEDPTVLRDDAAYTVFYSSVRGGGTESCLCYAKGAALGSLGKCGPVIIEPAYEYSKEMSTFKNPDGARTFYFESRANGASVVAVASENGSLEHWCGARTILEPRPGYWDCRHVSTGPVVEVDGKSMMFYNGCDDEGCWRVGVAAFDAETGAVASRSDEPLFEPYPPEKAWPDIVFANSALWADGELLLYYTRGDAEARRLRLAFDERAGRRFTCL